MGNSEKDDCCVFYTSIERAMIISDGPALEVHLPEMAAGQKGSQGKPLRDVEREQIMKASAWC